MKKLLLLFVFASLTTMPMVKIDESATREVYGKIINPNELHAVKYSKKRNEYILQKHTRNAYGLCTLEDLNPATYTQAEAASKFNEYKNLYIAQQQLAAQQNQ